jgi:mono/diheme cytochrome c family protein
MRTAIASILFLGLCVTPGIHVEAQQPASVWDGVYAADQAARGKAVFAELCSTCHGETLKGKSGGAPPLSGATFKENWNGLTTGDLFDYIKTSMPRYDSGRLTKEQAADLVAYLLTFNGFPAGSKDLPNDMGALKSIRFESEKPK